MSVIYHDGCRELQDRFDTRRIADRIEDVLLHDFISEPDAAFIEDVDMFFIAPADEDVHDPWAWEGRVLFSEPEKAAFHKLIELGYVDAFRRFPHPPKTFTWWDYRLNGFKRNRGLRIDHVLVSPALVPCLRGALVDVAPRTLEKPSDHAPVLVSMEL